MNNKKIYWIDDSNDPSAYVPKGASKKHLETELGGEMIIPAIKEHLDFSKLIAEFNSSKTIGVMMDYQLTRVGAGGRSEFGTVWAAQLRAAQPSIPIIGLSSMPQKEIPRLQIENFLAFFNRKSLLGRNPPVAELKALFTGYNEIWKKYHTKKKTPGLDLMMTLISPPQDAVELLRVAIPANLRSPWDIESPHTAARWIWHQFQNTPGFLFDGLGAATYLGLTESAFAQLQTQESFREAEYNGVLACAARPRWWICKMREAVEKIMKQRVSGPVSQSRDLLLGALNIPAKKHKAMLAVPHGRKTSGLIPECIAFPDQDSKNEGLLNERVAAMLADTMVDEADSNPPFGFQAIRHFKLNTSL